MVRTPHIDEKGVKKGTWTVEEDKKLIAYVSRYGCWNWRQLPKYAGLSRCGKSCRLRWMNYLRPNIRRGNYSKEEEDIIIKLHDSLGNRWSMIASHLPGRTDNEIKNHWHGYLKKRLIQSSSSFKPQSGSSEHSANPEDKEDTPMNSPYVDQPIVQSSRFSPKPSSAECSSSNADTGVVTDTDCFAGNDISPADIILENGGNFWAEPFVPDNYIYSTPTYCLEPFMDDGILYPPSPFRGNEFYSSDLMYNY